MKHTTRGLLTALALTALTASIAIASDTQENPGYTFTRTPSHGKPGTVIHFEGTGCAYEGKPYEYARVALYFREKDGSVTLEAEGRYDIEDDGSFAGDLTVPKHARPGKDPLIASCRASDMVFPVADSHFTVDGPAPTPTASRAPTAKPTPTATTSSPRPKPSRNPSPTPSASRPASPRPTPSRTTARALPSPTLPVATPSPSAVASARPTDPQSLPAVLVLAALALIAANGLGLHAALRRPSR